MYPNLQATATRLLTRFGQPRSIVFSLLPASEGNPWEPSAGVPEEYEVPGVVLPVTSRVLHSLDDKFEQGVLVESNVRMVVMAVVDTSGLALPAPKPADRLLFDESAWSVLGITPISPGGIPLIYKVACKR